MKVYQKYLNWSKMGSFILSLLLLIILLNIEYQNNYELFLAINGLYCVVYALIFLLDIKQNLEKNIYYKHQKFLFFPLKRTFLIVKESEYFFKRVDVYIFQMFILILQYKMYLNVHNIKELIFYFILFYLQTLFILLIFLCVKSAVKDSSKTIQYLAHPFFVILISVIFINNMLLSEPLNTIANFSPFHGLFYVLLQDSFDFDFLVYLILAILFIVPYLIIRLKTKEWPL